MSKTVRQTEQSCLGRATSLGEGKAVQNLKNFHFDGMITCLDIFSS